MTEKEKMLAGIPYDSRDTELVKMSNTAKRLVAVYNNIDVEDMEERKRVLNNLLGKLGNNTRINQPFYVDYGCNIYIGENSLVNLNCTFLDTTNIVIGDRTLIAPNVKIYTAYHEINGYKRRDSITQRIKTMTNPVIIGDDCWIGGGSIILPGVTIGNNVTVGAGSVVRESLPDNVVACGNPCTVKKINI